MSPAQQIGQQLRTAREAQGLSLLDVVDRLKLSPRQLEAIEAGQFDRLPGVTFVRGFVRNYARFLELDSDGLMALLDAQFPPVKVEPAPVVAAVAEQRPARSGKNWLWLLPLLAAGGVIGWLQFAKQTTSSSEPQALQLEVQGASVPVVESSLPAAEQKAEASAMQAVAPVVASAPAVAAPVVAANPAPTASAPVAAAGEKSVRLTTRQESWVEVSDAHGKKVIFGLLPAGSDKQATGVPPFKLTIGNAAQVDLAYDGAAVDLKSKIRGTTAKFELN
ncbi:RodZ domain-containing protein [Vogesella oryzae]|uniref:RodZ domain-containing protein n=1 Tax=Vogesella oryzae TaxID=1735285 RepID=UPI001FEAFCC9|nr:RodZ domain-containing protein [Vogesella oryzae]